MKKNVAIILLMFLLTMGCTTNGQQTEMRKTMGDGTPYMGHLENLGTDIVSQHPFIHYELNTLHYDSTSVTMRHFFERWRQVAATGDGTLNIVHIGSSHVQGGMLPHRIRCDILEAYPDRVGSRGFLFPYSAAANCNNPYDYRVHCREAVRLTRCVYKEPEAEMGVSGITVTTHDSAASVQVILKEPRFDFQTRKVSLFGRWVSDSDAVATGCHPQDPSIDLCGDSCDIHIASDSVWSYELRGVLMEGPTDGITYHSIGVNGAALGDYLKCSHFCDDLRPLHPDLVIFGIGINDAHSPNFDTAVFRSTYLQLIDSIRAVNPECAFLFITNNDSYRRVKKRYQVNANNVMARDAFYRLAHDTDGAVWDQFEVMGGLKSMEQWRKAKLARNDRVHFTRAGYELLGDLLSEALLKAMDSYVKTTTTPRQTNNDNNQPHTPLY